MRLDVYILKNKKKKIKILSYEMKRFTEKGFSNRLKNLHLTIKENFENVKDSDIIQIYIDLKINNKMLLGGCSISGATINATRVSIVEMAFGQLVRQIKDTLKQERKK